MQSWGSTLHVMHLSSIKALLTFYPSGLVVEDAISGLKAGKTSGTLTLGVCTSTERAILVEKGKLDYIVRDLTWWNLLYSRWPFELNGFYHQRVRRVATRWQAQSYHQQRLGTGLGSIITVSPLGNIEHICMKHGSHQSCWWSHFLEISKFHLLRYALME